jgi:hypothetical protein
MRDYQLSLAEIAAGTVPTPIAIWNQDIKQRAGLLSRYSETTVRHALLPRDAAAVSEAGIYFRGCYYTCPEGVSKGWFVSARKRRFKLVVSYDSRLVDSIYVHGETGTGEPCVATLTSRSQKYKGLSFPEVKYYEQLLAATRPQVEDSRAQTMLRFHEQILPVVDASKKRLRDEGKKTSRSARRADIREDRAQELRKERQALAASPVPVTPGPAAAVVPLRSIVTRTAAADKNAAEREALPAEMTPAQRAHELRRKMFNGL